MTKSGRTVQGRQYYQRQNKGYSTKTFLLDYHYKAYVTSVKHQVVKMAINGNGIPFIRSKAINWIMMSLLIVWLAPNTQQIIVNFKPALDMPNGSSAKRLLWQPSYAWLIASVFCAVFSILSISELSEFIYFQF